MTLQERIEYFRERTRKRREAKSKEDRPQPSAPTTQSKASQKGRYTLPCVHEGAILEWCNTCNGEMKHVRDCDIYERCTRGNVSDKVKSCIECTDYIPESSSDRLRAKKSSRNTHPEKKDDMAKQPATREEIAKKLAERRLSRGRKSADSRIIERKRGEAFGADKKIEGMVWQYGITTVDERRYDLLPRTIESLKNAGFDKPRLFVDGSNALTDYAKTFGLPITVRGNDNIRTFGNWVLAMMELYLRNPHAHRYALFQDDVIACCNLKKYLEHVAYPDGDDGRNKGYLNLITYPQNEGLSKSHHDLPEKEGSGWYPSNQMGKGAQGLVFDNKALVALLGHPYMIERPKDLNRGWQGIDGGIVTAMKRIGYKEYVHTPSLIRHIGTETSMGPSHPKTQPIDLSFRGEGWDAMSLLKDEHKEDSIPSLQDVSDSETLPEKKVDDIQRNVEVINIRPDTMESIPTAAE